MGGLDKGDWLGVVLLAGLANRAADQRAEHMAQQQIEDARRGQEEAILRRGAAAYQAAQAIGEASPDQLTAIYEAEAVLQERQAAAEIMAAEEDWARRTSGLRGTREWFGLVVVTLICAPVVFFLSLLVIEIASALFGMESTIDSSIDWALIFTGGIGFMAWSEMIQDHRESLKQLTDEERKWLHFHGSGHRGHSHPHDYRHSH